MKLRKKLLLSCAALAACATTMVSTSYAWYVSNSSAAVDAVSGATGGASVSGNLLVSHDAGGKPEAYGQTIDFEDAANYVKNVDLWPCTYGTKTEGETTVDDTTKFVKNGESDVVDSTDYIEIKFWIFSSDNSDIVVKLTATNTTKEADFVDQTLYNETGRPTGVNLLGEFHKDAVQALHMDMTLTEYNDVDGTLTASQPKDYERYSVAEVATSYTKAGTAAEGGDANAYYYAIMGKYPVAGQTYTDTAFDNAKFSTLTLTPSVDTLVTIRIWLDGRDADCFDSCINQSFNLDFDFEVKATGTGE